MLSPVVPVKEQQLSNSKTACTKHGRPAIVHVETEDIPWDVWIISFGGLDRTYVP